MKTRNFILLLLGVLFCCTTSAWSTEQSVTIVSPADAKVFRVLVQPGSYVYSGDEIATLKKSDGTVILLRAGSAGKISALTLAPYQKIHKDEVLGTLESADIVIDQPAAGLS